MSPWFIVEYYFQSSVEKLLQETFSTTLEALDNEERLLSIKQTQKEIWANYM